MARRRSIFDSSPDSERSPAPALTAMPSQLAPVSQESRNMCMLVVDDSGSMAVSGALAAVLSALPDFRASILEHPVTTRKLSFAVLAFSDKPRVLQDYAPVTSWEPPTELGGGNGSAMATAILEALRLEEKHRKDLAAQAIPVQSSFIFLVTDAYLNSEPRERFEEAARRIKERAKKRLAFFSIAVENADIQTLQQLTPERTPLKLREVDDFHKFLEWVGDSIVEASMTQPGMRITLPNPLKTTPHKENDGTQTDAQNPRGWAELPC